MLKCQMYRLTKHLQTVESINVPQSSALYPFVFSILFMTYRRTLTILWYCLL